MSSRMRCESAERPEPTVSMPVDLDVFRAIVGSFPTGVTIVTARDVDASPRGLTSNAFASVSARPPLVLVCVDKSSNTLRAVRNSRAFAVNFLSAGREKLAARFASKAADKFSGVAWRPSAAAGGAPILAEDSVAVAECTVVDAIEAGDHWIFVGSVEGGEVFGGHPLMYYRRAYAIWPDVAR